MTTKIYDWFEDIENVYIDPVPYDGGLAIGAARYLWHHILDNPNYDVTEITNDVGEIIYD